MADVPDKRAPMASAPMKYQPDGSVDWGNMWDSFCALAQDGGPPHRPTMLYAQTDADPANPAYQTAVAEICRGIAAVSGLDAHAAEPGWIAVACPSAGMARWVAEAIEQENVQSRAHDAVLYVPVGDYFALKGEIKNVITAVAKTTHYWADHLPAEVKSAFAIQARMQRMGQRMRRWFRR